MWHYASNLYHNKQGPFYLTLEFVHKDAKVVEKWCSGTMLWIGIPNLEIVSCKQVAFHDYCELNGHQARCYKDFHAMLCTPITYLHHTFSNHDSTDICQGQQPNKRNFRNSCQNHYLINRTNTSWKYNRKLQLKS